AAFLLWRAERATPAVAPETPVADQAGIAVASGPEPEKDEKPEAAGV
ncbi:hypothetical protein G3I39_30655, partial [Streptomyces fulvissimus]|nr:hypothetical protein [Streptomyces microflavus]